MTGKAPTTRVVERNIEALLAHRQAKEDGLGWQDKLAAHIASFAGSMNFVWLHILAYGFWVAINLGIVPAVPQFDPTFVVTAHRTSVMFASYVKRCFAALYNGARRGFAAGSWLFQCSLLRRQRCGQSASFRPGYLARSL